MLLFLKILSRAASEKVQKKDSSDKSEESGIYFCNYNLNFTSLIFPLFSGWM